jgi:predicted amidohydrolase
VPKLVVACVQQQMRLFDSPEDYRKELNRFFYLARAKAARLVVFPALTGLMAVVPQVEGFRMSLLRRADERRRGEQNLWSRTRGAIAGKTAKVLKVSFRKALAELLAEDPETLRSAYESVFSGLAEAYAVTVVAGTAYLPDGAGVPRHQATVFGPDGRVLGRQNKLVLDAGDEGLAEPGTSWTAVDTPAGRLGLLIGQDALYPEAGRLLAYQGVDLFVALGATARESTAAHMRHGTIARAQENQCFGLTSFLVGKNYLAEGAGATEELLGKAGIYAPLEMTPRFTGVLVEMGTTNSEGLLTAELDPEELRTLRQTGSQPVRRQMPAGAFEALLPPLYARGQTLADAATAAEIPPAVVELPALPAVLSLPDAGTLEPPVVPSEQAEAEAGAPAESGTALPAVPSSPDAGTLEPTVVPSDQAEAGAPAESGTAQQSNSETPGEHGEEEEQRQF